MNDADEFWKPIKEHWFTGCTMASIVYAESMTAMFTTDSDKKKFHINNATNMLSNLQKQLDHLDRYMEENKISMLNDDPINNCLHYIQKNMTYIHNNAMLNLEAAKKHAGID